jgi:hypothetical protein
MTSQYDRFLALLREMGVNVLKCGESDRPEFGALLVEIDRGTGYAGFSGAFYFDVAGKFVQHKLWE